MRTPELNLRNKLVATAAVIGGLLVSGCGEEEPTAQRPVAEVDPVAASLKQYRDDVNYRRHARVAMNTCAGWQNISGGVTIVENPGIVTAQTPEGPYSYLIFSVPDSDQKPPALQQMNGPQIYVDEKNRVFGGGPYAVKLSIDLEKSDSYYAHATERALTQKPTEADNGQIYFRDQETGVHLMNSIVTDGPFSDERVWQACQALGKDQPVASLIAK